MIRSQAAAVFSGRGYWPKSSHPTVVLKYFCLLFQFLLAASPLSPLSPLFPPSPLSPLSPLWPKLSPEAMCSFYCQNRTLKPLVIDDILLLLHKRAVTDQGLALILA